MQVTPLKESLISHLGKDCLLLIDLSFFKFYNEQPTRSGKRKAIKVIERLAQYFLDNPGNESDALHCVRGLLKYRLNTHNLKLSSHMWDLIEVDIQQFIDLRRSR